MAQSSDTPVMLRVIAVQFAHSFSATTRSAGVTSSTWYTPETDNALIIWLGTISRPSVAARDATQFCMALLAASFTDLAS